MIVNCEGCETGFQVNEGLLKPGGSKVRCSKCRHVFVVYPPPPPLDDSEEPLMLSEEFAAPEAGAEDGDMASIAAKLDEIFGDPAAAAETAAPEEPELLDVGDLMAEEAAGVEEPAGGDRQELHFETDPGSAAEMPEAAAAGRIEGTPPAASEMEIDFDLDLEPAAKPADAGGDFPDVNELELDLNDLEAAVEDAASPAAAAAGGAGDPDVEFNLDFEMPLQESTPAAAEAAGANEADVSSEALSLDLINELNLDLDSDPEATTTTLSKNAKKANPLAKTDQIDLEDLEHLIDDLEPDLASPVAAGGEEPVHEIPADPDFGEPAELDLSSLTDIGDEPVKQAPANDPVTPTAAADAAPAEMGSSDELDFSDLSGILEGEGVQAEKLEESQDIELVLEDAAPAAEAAAAEMPMLDIEAFLADDQAGRAASGPPAEPAPAKKATTELEIEFEPVEESAGVGGAVAAAAAVGATAGVEADDVSTQPSALAGARDSTDVLDIKLEPEEEPVLSKKPVAVVPRRSGGLLRVLAALVVVAVLALAALIVPRSLGIHIPYLTDTEIPVLSEIDIEIPYIGHIGKLFKAEPADPAGRLKILPEPASVTAEYIDNEAAGRLLVVKGKVRNAYDHPRSAVRVTATLFGQGGSALTAATVYAGNILTGEELATLDMNAIQSRLRFSAAQANRQQVARPGASGDVAQLVRACGSYPQSPGFKSLHRHQEFGSSRGRERGDGDASQAPRKT
jgi:predicted Zn finger-like uncharacterized protein